MRKIVALLVIVLLLLQSFSKLGIYVSFKINQSYIANTLCINKAKPQLQCNGKCYLSKKLRQAEAESQKQQAAGLKLPELLLCCQPLSVFSFHCLEEIPHTASFPPVLLFPLSLLSKGIFHPPKD